MAGASAGRADEPASAGRASGPGVQRLRRVGAGLQSRVSRPTGWILALLALALLQLTSAHPGNPPAGHGWRQFLGGWLWNGGHAFAYGVVALLATLGLPRRDGWPRLDARAFRVLLFGVLVAGVLDEWHQSTVPRRNFSALDLVTDLVGAASTLSVIAYVGRADAASAGLRARLCAGGAACLAAALLATLGDRAAERFPWL